MEGEGTVKEVRKSSQTKSSDDNDPSLQLHTHHALPFMGGEEPELDLPHDVSHKATKDPFYAPYSFIVMCCLQIVWGIVGAIKMSILQYARNPIKLYILLDLNFSDHSHIYLLAAVVLTIAGGIFGIIAIAFDVSFLLHLLPHFLWIIVTMCISSSVIAKGNLDEPVVSIFYRLFEATAIYPHDPSYLHTVWPHVKPTIWDSIQTEMKCCGVENMKDWIKILGRPIPNSCCKQDEVKVCKSTLDLWRYRPDGANKTVQELLKTFEDVQDFLYKDSCVHAITEERKNHIRDWTIYPLIFLSIHLLMLFHFNYLISFLIHEHGTWQGIARLERFRSQRTEVVKARLMEALYNMIPFCCKKEKEKAHLHLEKCLDVDYKESVLDHHKRPSHHEGVHESPSTVGGIGSRPSLASSLQHHDHKYGRHEEGSSTMMTPHPEDIETPSQKQWHWKRKQNTVESKPDNAN